MQFFFTLLIRAEIRSVVVQQAFSASTLEQHAELSSYTTRLCICSSLGAPDVKEPAIGMVYIGQLPVCLYHNGSVSGSRKSVRPVIIESSNVTRTTLCLVPESGAWFVDKHYAVGFNLSMSRDFKAQRNPQQRDHPPWNISLTSTTKPIHTMHVISLASDAKIMTFLLRFEKMIYPQYTPHAILPASRYCNMGMGHGGRHFGDMKRDA
ncbi:hypothetical protein WAI453_010391 [Rhynchosporium graminicola]